VCQRDRRGRQKSCELEAIEHALTPLAALCESEPEEQRTPCLARKLIEKYGP
jgi:hypothetical protein